MRRRWDAAVHGEQGVALITALLVSFVVLIMSVTIVNLTVHNQRQSGSARQRVQSIAAAEAGIDYYLSYLQHFSESLPLCSISRTLPTVNPATFTATPTFYDAAGTTLSCPLPASAHPAAVLIRSVGRTGADVTRRTMEAYATLSALPGPTFDNVGAMFAEHEIHSHATGTIGGNQYNDADVYSNGKIRIHATMIFNGSVYGQDEIELKKGTQVRRHAWAYKKLELKDYSRVAGNAVSSIEKIEGGGSVGGNARAGKSIQAQVSGTVTPDSPSAAPTLRTYPTFTYDSAAWSSAGYTIRNYTDCNAAEADIASWWGASSGSNLVRVTGGCKLENFASSAIKGNLAIVTDDDLKFKKNVRWTASGGPWNVHIFACLNEDGGCEVKFEENSGIGANLPTMIYTTPDHDHKVHSDSSFIVSGQVFAGKLDLKKYLNFSYVRLPVPGVGIGGYLENVEYKREVVGS